MAITTSSSSIESLYQPNESARVAPQKTLGQDDFLKLLTTQMANQDPTNPVDNTKMIADMAQFSSLQAMKELNTVAGTMLTQMKMSQAIQASALVGKSVVDTGNTLTVEAGKKPVLQLESISDLSNVKVQIQDASGFTVATVMADQIKEGITDAGWNGLDDKGQALPPGKYQVLAYGTNDVGGTEQIGTLVGFKVTSVDIGASGAVINLEDGTSTTLENVKQIH